jgi:hypothetical protein
MQRLTRRQNLNRNFPTTWSRTWVFCLLVTLPTLLAAEIGLRDAESRNAKDKLALLLVKRVGRYACIGLGDTLDARDAFLPSTISPPGDQHAFWGRGVRTFLFNSRPVDHPMGRLTQNLSFAAVSFLCHAGALLTYYSIPDMLLTKSGGRCRTSLFDITFVVDQLRSLRAKGEQTNVDFIQLCNRDQPLWKRSDGRVSRKGKKIMDDIYYKP